jgi:23S rRNA (adenine2030-N6)-methyltransferase
MFSYRHAFHAGNHADVLKHLTLVAIVKHLTAKDSGVFVVDTHAGAGLYRLDGDMARTSEESHDGFLKLFLKQNQPLPGTKYSINAINSVANDHAPAVADYLAAIAHFNAEPDKPRVYPGSPLLMHSLLRPGVDRMRLFELHPTDYRALSGHVRQLGGDAKTAVVDCANGFDQLKTLLPPPAPLKRALVLIDPSYELKSDYAQVSAGIQEALKRFPTGCFVVWYPIIPRPEAHSLPKKLKTLATQAGKPSLNATLNIGQDSTRPAPGEKPSRHTGLRASGMFVINPPHTLKAALQQALPQLAQALGRGRGKGFTLA